MAAAIKNRTKNARNGEMLETDAYIIYTIGVDIEDPHLNGALCLDDNYAEEMLAKADEFFRARNRNYVVWVRGHADHKLETMLKSRGLKPKREPGSAGMIIKERIGKVGIPEGFYLSRLDEEAKDNLLSLLNAEDKEVLKRLIREAKDETIYFRLTREAIPFLTRLSTRELFFCTFYFTKYPCTIWGNYNMKFPVFFNSKDDIERYIFKNV